MCNFGKFFTSSQLQGGFFTHYEYMSYGEGSNSQAT